MRMTLAQAHKEFSPMASIFGWTLVMDDTHDTLFMKGGDRREAVITAAELADLDNPAHLIAVRMRKIAYAN